MIMTEVLTNLLAVVGLFGVLMLLWDLCWFLSGIVNAWLDRRAMIKAQKESQLKPLTLREACAHPSNCDCAICMPPIPKAKPAVFTRGDGKPRVTLSGNAPHPDWQSGAAPQPIDPKTGQHKDYWVLPEEERAKGFVRPYRNRYRHVGRRVCGKIASWCKDTDPKGNVCVLSPDHEGECTQWIQCDWSKTEEILRTHQLGGCGGGVTTMSRPLSETYARDPKYYSSTFCCICGSHFPVSEFVWDADGEEVGS